MSSTRAAWTKRIAGAVVDVRHLGNIDRPPRRQKYGARARDVDGFHFDSTKEAKRYRELVLLQLAGDISHLEIHPTYTIDVVPLAVVYAGAPLSADALILVGMYTADFRYVDASGAVVVEDVKSKPTKTTAYRLRKRLVEAIYGITITEL